MAQYYVDSSVESSGNGLTPETAWKDLSDISGLQAEDIVSFKCGQTWSGQTYSFTVSGSDGNPITFNSYGSGNKPIIHNGEVLSGWTLDAGNIWKISSLRGNVLLLDGVWGYLQDAKGNLAAQGDWYYDSDLDEIYLYSTSDPDDAYDEILTDKSDALGTINCGGNDYLTFNGLDIRISAFYSFVANNSTHITISDCVFKYAKQQGFRAGSSAASYDTHDITITDSEFSDNGHSGAALAKYTHTVTFDGCEACYNGQDPNQGWAGGIRPVTSPDANAQTTYSIIVENCICHHNGYDRNDSMITGIHANYEADGIWMDTMGSNSGANPCIVRYCWTYTNNGSGIYGENSVDLEIYHNITNGNVAGAIANPAGIRLGCSYTSAPVDSNKVYNNTCYDNEHGIFVHGYYQYTDGDTVLDNLIKNNISSDNNTYEFKAVNGADNTHTADGWGSGNVYTYNCFGAESSNFIEYGNGTYHSTYDAWETAYGSGTNSVEADPSMIDPANDNFRLKSSSLCIDAGIDVSLTFDYDKGKIPCRDGFDIGAFEHARTFPIFLFHRPPRG